ncbi:hypothetical protein QTN25_001576 [Entamoeba marina]
MSWLLILFNSLVVFASFTVEQYPPKYDRSSSVRLYGYPQPEQKNNISNNLSLMLIRTTPARLHYHSEIRKTWCDPSIQQQFEIKCLFYFVSSTVKNFHDRNDILTTNWTTKDIRFVDLPLKTEGWWTIYHKNIMILNDAINTFPNYKYYSIVDDEDYINVDLFSNFVNAMERNNSVMGKFIRVYPKKRKTSRYYDPLAPSHPYYPFPTGELMVFSPDIARYISSMKNYYVTPPTVLDDTAIGYLIYKYFTKTKKPVNLYKPKELESMLVHSKQPTFQVNHTQALSKRLLQTLI